MLIEGFIRGYFAGATLVIALMLLIDKIPVNNTIIGIFIGTALTIFVIGLMNAASEGDYISLTREELLDLLDGKLLSQEEVDKLIKKLTD